MLDVSKVLIDQQFIDGSVRPLILCYGLKSLTQYTTSYYLFRHLSHLFRHLFRGYRRLTP